jgi:hypothetical protein
MDTFPKTAEELTCTSINKPAKTLSPAEERERQKWAPTTDNVQFRTMTKDTDLALLESEFKK